MEKQLSRVLGFWDLFFIAVGQVIGAGAVALTGVAIGLTGPGVVWAYLCAALLVILSSLLPMVAGSVLPVVGAYYVWPARLRGGWIGSVSLSMVLMVSVISISLFGSAFGLYLHPIFPVLSQNVWGIVMIVLIFMTNYFGLRLASIVQTVLVLIMLTAFALYVGFAAPDMQMSDLSPMLPSGIFGFLTAVFILKFSTAGASNIVSLGGDMKNPGRDIPLVMVCATAFVGVVYGLIAFASIAALPWAEMADQPLTVAGRAFMPNWALTYFLIGGAAIALATTLNATIMQIPRNFVVAAWDQLIPQKLGALNRHGVPVHLLNILLVLGTVPLIIGLDIGTIARAVGIATALPFIVILWSIMRIPKMFPEAYANTSFTLNAFWLWILFVLSLVSVLVGLVILSVGVTTPVLATIIIWTHVSVAYYPLRRAYLRGRGVDLDRNTSDLSIFNMSSASTTDE